MAASPKLKVFTPKGEYVASCKFADDAAAIVAKYGHGAKIKYEHKHVVWVEGDEPQPASESYGFVENTVEDRIGRRAWITPATPRRK